MNARPRKAKSRLPPALTVLIPGQRVVKYRRCVLLLPTATRANWRKSDASWRQCWRARRAKTRKHLPLLLTVRSVALCGDSTSSLDALRPQPQPVECCHAALALREDAAGVFKLCERMPSHSRLFFCQAPHGPRDPRRVCRQFSCLGRRGGRSQQPCFHRCEERGRLAADTESAADLSDT